MSSNVMIIVRENENVQNPHTYAQTQTVSQTEMDGNMWFIMFSHVHFVVDAKRIYHAHTQKATKQE